MNSLCGKMLIALPELQESFFHQALIFIWGHDEEEGALGFVLNHQTSFTMRDVFDVASVEPEQQANVDRPVFLGGPVHPRLGFGLYVPDDPDDDCPDGPEIEDGIRVTSSRHLLQLCAEGTEPRDLLFLFGYAGWDEGQLEREMGEGLWWEVSANLDIMFHTPPEQRWARAMEELDINPSAVIPGSGHA